MSPARPVGRFHQRSTARTGWTLVELLVVVAIIGLLLAMLLPAVQSVREAARRAACQNNLRQLGIAIHSYEGVYQALPPGCHEWRPWGGNPALKNFAWSAMILPFLEQVPLHHGIDFGLPFDHPVNLELARQTIPVFLCPSNAIPLTQTLGRSDYGGLFGQRITTRTGTNNGLFIYNRAIKFSEITDGLTHTIAVAEDSGGPNAEWINGNNVFEQSGGINDPNAWIGDNEIRSRHPGGALALMCCGRVEFFSNDLDKPVLAALITRDFGD